MTRAEASLRWICSHAASLALGAGLCLALLAFWQAAHRDTGPMTAEIRALETALATERARLAEMSGQLDEIRADSMESLWGVQIASFADLDTARRAWDQLSRQRDFNTLEARITSHVVTSGKVIRLMAGPFQNAEAAREFCNARKHAGSMCMPAPFKGEPAG